MTSEEVNALIQEAKEWTEYLDSGPSDEKVISNLIKKLLEALKAVKYYADHGPPGQ